MSGATGRLSPPAICRGQRPLKSKPGDLAVTSGRRTIQGSAFTIFQVIDRVNRQRPRRCRAHRRGLKGRPAAGSGRFCPAMMRGRPLRSARNTLLAVAELMPQAGSRAGCPIAGRASTLGLLQVRIADRSTASDQGRASPTVKAARICRLSPVRPNRAGGRHDVGPRRGQAGWPEVARRIAPRHGSRTLEGRPGGVRGQRPQTSRPSGPATKGRRAAHGRRAAGLGGVRVSIKRSSAGLAASWDGG